ncbi:MAG: hypothetical protein F6K11_15840 [Leptolyngbya sp. SIO3F4]|nr:hypothetical protein [Leptolyngbya sp. SIO3F4]
MTVGSAECRYQEITADFGQALEHNSITLQMLRLNDLEGVPVDVSQALKQQH